jgi:uncharacterized protein YutE (UPF0331/DUF86 family)
MGIEPDDIILNKIAVIQSATGRALEEYHKNPALSSFTELDALILNLERACQATIDLAIHIISREKWGIPQSSSDAFRILESKSLLQQETTKSLTSMVGFRNIAIYEYQKLNTDIIIHIMENDYQVFSKFCQELGFKI